LIRRQATLDEHATGMVVSLETIEDVCFRHVV
jgi:hypothetical protein